MSFSVQCLKANKHIAQGATLGYVLIGLTGRYAAKLGSFTYFMTFLPFTMYRPLVMALTRRPWRS